MMKVCKTIVFALGLLAPVTVAAQNDSTIMVADSIRYDSIASSIDLLTKERVAEPINVNKRMTNRSPYKFKPGQLIIPITLIGVGIIGLESDWLKYQNREMRDELQENIDRRLTMDDFTQYAPMAAVYGLNLFGVKGKHDFVDRTIILSTAYALMGITVNSLKTITKVERPDGSSLNSFPSGHTATAFMGAEFLRREYWDVSPWIGVAGYAVAAGTGFFRMYNNRHWLTDVAAGAGIGILSVQAAYWLHPMISETFFHKRYLKNIYIFPHLSPQEKGLSCQIVF